jgi:hypothetical protein
MERNSSQRCVALADMPSENDAAPVCLSCGQNTRLIRTISNLGILPELLVFQCPNCHCVRAVQPTAVRRSAYSGWLIAFAAVHESESGPSRHFALTS